MKEINYISENYPIGYRLLLCLGGAPPGCLSINEGKIEWKNDSKKLNELCLWLNYGFLNDDIKEKIGKLDIESLENKFEKLKNLNNFFKKFNEDIESLINEIEYYEEILDYLDNDLKILIIGFVGSNIRIFMEGDLVKDGNKLKIFEKLIKIFYSFLKNSSKTEWFDEIILPVLINIILDGFITSGKNKLILTVWGFLEMKSKLKLMSIFLSLNSSNNDILEWVVCGLFPYNIIDEDDQLLNYWNRNLKLFSKFFPIIEGLILEGYKKPIYFFEATKILYWWCHMVRNPTRMTNIIIKIIEIFFELNIEKKSVHINLINFVYNTLKNILLDYSDNPVNNSIEILEKLISKIADWSSD